MYDQESNRSTVDELNLNETDCNCDMESSVVDEDKHKMKKKPFFLNNDDNEFHILHPDDPLMKKFQDTLKAHLIRTDNKLSEEIREIKNALKSIEKEREDGGSRIRILELEILNQRRAIENYENLSSEAIASRENDEKNVTKFKEERKKKLDELKTVESKYTSVQKQLEELSLKAKWYENLDNEITSEVSISRTISAKDDKMQHELLREKRQKDYILYKLDEELWKIDNEKRHLETQLEIMNEEKRMIGQSISDANADLEELQKELKSLMKNWNIAMLYIKQRDEISLEQNKKCREMQSNLKSLQLEMDSLKKETTREMEKNKELTEMKNKVDNELRFVTEEYDFQREKTDNLERELDKIAKIYEQCEKMNKETINKLQSIETKEAELDQKLESELRKKLEAENRVLEKLNETMMQDKTIRNLNKELQEAKQKNREHEFLIAQAESTHSKNVLAIQKLLSAIDEEKFNLEELVKINVEKEKQLAKSETNVKKCITSIGVKEAKVQSLKKKIEEILHATKGEEVNVYELKIATLEKSIEEVENKNCQTQKLWLRQQGNLIHLREQRNAQLQELSLLTKQIMIIEQKNYKFEYELERQKKEQNNIDRKMHELQQALLQKNVLLAARKDFKQHMEDVNYFTRNESVISLEEAEKELRSMQNDIWELKNTKETLNNLLYDVQLESLSWEKKVEMACEASKNFKEERKGGGDIATMKNEIHKMEMRLSHLKKFQQKLIQDMEFCISRRENILDRVMAEEKRNPKNEHNRRIIVQKRLDDQKLKIKQMNKEIKQVQDEITKLEEIQKEMQEEIDKTQESLREIENDILDIDKKIQEAEMIKSHNLEILIRKQRKATLLQRIKNGNYKSLYKSDIALNEEMQRQKNVNENLKEILSQTLNDFPQLKTEIQKMLMSLDV